MTVIETSKLLLECAEINEIDGIIASLQATRARILKNDELEKYWRITYDSHRAYAAAIKSIVIPAPLGSDETVAKVKQWIECSNCGAKATITYESTAGVLPVALHCKCGTVTPYEKGSDDDPSK